MTRLKILGAGALLSAALIATPVLAARTLPEPAAGAVDSVLGGCNAHLTGVMGGDRPVLGVHPNFDSGADAILWPPNHKFHTVEINGQLEGGNEVVNSVREQAQQAPDPVGSLFGDECDTRIISVHHDEFVQDGVAELHGAGRTFPDAQDYCRVNGNTVRIDLRGERSGLGTGRFYHIVVEMTHPLTQEAQTEDLLVLVPHDQGVSKVSVDEGPLGTASEEGAFVNEPSCSGGGNGGGQGPTPQSSGKAKGGSN